MKIYAYGDKAYGIWYIRFGIRVISLKAPWSHKYFSERNGYRKPFFTFRDWRLFYEKDFHKSY